MSKKTVATEVIPPRTLLVGIYAPYNRSIDKEDYFEEFVNLVETAGIKPEATFNTKLRSIDKSLFLTKGKLHDVLNLCTQHRIEEIVFSDILSPLQERNLGDALGCKVFDRAGLILEIFRRTAHTAEGKLQVEMAAVEFLKSRLAGKGIELAQQAGYTGGKGPGETNKEYIRRHLEEKTRQAKKKLACLQRSRETQRKQRLDSGIPFLCLIGYTNAGKSSLINRLTKSDILAEDKLFATLDTTTRALYVEHEKIGLISDTVGFINHLPHHLIEAFKSTLDELNYASLLLHVVDISNHAWENQIKVVQETVKELGVADKPMLYLFNKIDKISKEKLEELRPKIEEYQPHLLTHAMSKEGIESLQKHLGKQFLKK
jgi:GTPase